MHRRLIFALAFGVTNKLSTSKPQLNRAGFPMKPGSGTVENKLYCGRTIEGGLPGSDGRCGPTNGPQCNDCIEYVSNQIVQTFHSSSERVVGIELNLDTLEMRYFIQSRYCKKQKCKKLETSKKQPLENMEWYPFIEFKEKDNTVTLNPFRSSPCPETTTAHQKSKLPASLGFDVSHLHFSVMENLVGARALVHHTFLTSRQIKLAEQIRKLKDVPEFEVVA